MGLVAGAMAQQMAGSGKVFRVFAAGCSDKALLELDMDGACRTSVRQIPLDVLQGSDPLASAWASMPAALEASASEEDKKRHETRTARITERRADLRDVLDVGFDAVVVIAEEDNPDLANDALELG